MITSTGNAQVKQVIQLNQKAKARRELGLFVAEGVKMLKEAPPDWIRRIYLSEKLEGNQELAPYLEGKPVEVVEDRVFRQMCDTKTPQGVLTLLQIPSYSLEDLLGQEAPLFVLLEDLQDPGNAGTIIRTAEAAGAGGILLTKHTADLFNPKVIRSTMGSIYRMPFYVIEDVQETMETLRARGIRSYAAHLSGDHTYDREDYRGGTVFLIGNEGNGLSDFLTVQADCRIRIPMEGQAESLNAAMAAGILLYEAARQRRG